MLATAPTYEVHTRARAAAIHLDRRDSAVLKALAIVAIVLHNFFHPVSLAHQNEFTFRPERFAVLLHTIVQPELAFQAFFSFFGHFGVQIFIFLSAYGLARSHADRHERWSTFMASRIRKLFPAFGIVVLPWLVMVCIQFGPARVLRQIGLNILLMFTGLLPIIPGFDLPPLVRGGSFPSSWSFMRSGRFCAASCSASAHPD